MESTESCYTCYYWDAPDETYLLSPMECSKQECRRYAPAVGDAEAEGCHSPAWPCTEPYDWCGEYRAKDLSSFWVRQKQDDNLSQG